MPEPVSSPPDSVGVHYTPDYVVDYMVRGALALDRPWTGPLSIVDPSCGDGAFLLGSAQYLAGQQPQPLSADERGELVLRQLYGVDLDATAVLAARSRLAAWIVGEEPSQQEKQEKWQARLAANVVAADALIELDWERTFPEVFAAGGFACVLGNPPYRRELDFRERMAAIAATPFGQRHRSARMDLWYYFVHRGLEILRPGGRLSFITSAYWTGGRGAQRMIAALEAETHLEELFALDKLPVFAGVSGRHLTFRAAKGIRPQSTLVRRVRRDGSRWAPPAAYFAAGAAVDQWRQEPAQLYRHGGLDLEPAAEGWLAKFDSYPTLGKLGQVRQGVAENPATINAKTAARHGAAWPIGTGVFVLTDVELAALGLSPDELRLVRPYHVLADVGRYRLDAPSRHLIYATRDTWPTLEACPKLWAHLERFRRLLEARREVRLGRISWWHLHWPRDPALWQREKLVVLQLGRRPGCVPAAASVCVPFTLNIWTPQPGLRIDLRYVCGILNSQLWWEWFAHHAKTRGAGLELNGHVLTRTPIPSIDFDLPAERAAHDEIVSLVAARLAAMTPAEQERLEGELEAAVRRLVGV